MKRLGVLLLLLVLASPAFAADRYVSLTGSDTNPGTLLLPYKTLDKAILAAMPADRIVLRGGTYPLNAGADLISMVAVVPYQAEAVAFLVPGQPAIPLNAMVTVWTDIVATGPPSVLIAQPDVRIILKPGGKLKAPPRITRRAGDTSTTMFITVNKSTVVVVE